MMITKNDSEPAGVKKQKPLRKENRPNRTSRNYSGSLPASCSGTHPDQTTFTCFTKTNFNTPDNSQKAAA